MYLLPCLMITLLKGKWSCAILNVNCCFKMFNHAKQIMSVPFRVYCNLLLSTWTGIKGLYYALFINE